MSLLSNIETCSYSTTLAKASRNELTQNEVLAYLEGIILLLRFVLGSKFQVSEIQVMLESLYI